MSLWAGLDELGGNISKSLGSVVDTYVQAHNSQVSNDAAVKIIDQNAARDTSGAGRTDPNSMQRYMLWGVLGLVGITLVVLVVRSAR
jgi:hypothetical protein